MKPGLTVRMPMPALLTSRAMPPGDAPGGPGPPSPPPAPPRPAQSGRGERLRHRESEAAGPAGHQRGPAAGAGLFHVLRHAPPLTAAPSAAGAGGAMVT